MALGRVSYSSTSEVVAFQRDEVLLQRLHFSDHIPTVIQGLMWYHPPVPLPPAREDDLPDTLGAYNICLALEEKATTDEDRMHARILGYLILHAPSSAARAEVVGVIHFYAQDETKLLDLGECFREWFIRPFKKSKAQTPISSDHSSCSSFDKLKKYLKEEIKEAPKDHTQAKAQALIRDGFKCPLTGFYDVMAYSAGVVERSAPVFVVRTQLARISPESTYSNVSKLTTGFTDKREYADLVLAVMSCFGYEVEKVNGSKVHSLHNVITMESNAHDAFDRLELWFESMEVPNLYRIESIYNLPNLLPSVEFQSPDPLNLPFPSPEFLASHATCAKVAHLSGAGQYIEKMDRDADSLDVLAPDGSSSAILTHVLSKSLSHFVGTVA